MLPSIRALRTAALLLGAGAPALAAQATPYVPLDDPRLPLFEHLVVRGDVADPTPFVRPFLRSEALRVLAAADTAPATPSGRLVHRLREEWAVPTSESWFDAGIRGGVQAYSHARRDPLHPAGPRGASRRGLLTQTSNTSHRSPSASRGSNLASEPTSNESADNTRC